MSDQPVLPIAAREYDLPPRWDGMTVYWDRWEPAPAISCIKLEPCQSCGVAAGEDINYGRCEHDVHTRLTSRFGHVRYLKLIARRCRHCGHDAVVDAITGDWWDLDDADYTSFGSVLTERTAGTVETMPAESRDRKLLVVPLGVEAD